MFDNDFTVIITFRDGGKISYLQSAESLKAAFKRAVKEWEEEKKYKDRLVCISVTPIRGSLSREEPMVKNYG